MAHVVAEKLLALALWHAHSIAIKGPTPNPCGECQSCNDLVANGPGSLDVIELDAATHGLVDDARDLRDKAFFAPVQ